MRKSIDCYAAEIVHVSRININNSQFEVINIRWFIGSNYLIDSWKIVYNTVTFLQMMLKQSKNLRLKKIIWPKKYKS